MSVADFGTPPESKDVVLSVGFDEGYLGRFFTDCRQVGEVDLASTVDSEEAGEPIQVCRGLRNTWAKVWPDLRRR